MEYFVAVIVIVVSLLIKHTETDMTNQKVGLFIKTKYSKIHKIQK